MSIERPPTVPPGQQVTEKFPVLTYGPTPRVDIQSWQLELHGEVEAPVVLTWTDVQEMPQTERKADFHCVTTWSRLDNRWTGVLLSDVLRRVRVHASARFVMAHAYGGYTANLPLDALLHDDVLLAHSHDGAPLTPEHGYPVRLVVPKKYAWKSVKWIRALEFMAEDRLGFWERNGYNNNADPWREERYW